MSRPRTPNNTICPNSDCEYHLSVEGKNSAGHQSVETANTPMYRRHVSEEELILIGKLLVEKVGNRARVPYNRINSRNNLKSYRCHHTSCKLEFNALMAGKSGVGQVELDEMWTFVKKQKMWTKEQQIQISKAMHGFIPESSEIQSS